MPGTSTTPALLGQVLRHRFGASLLMAALGLSFAGCGGGGGGGGSSPTPETWTVFVYAHADHNLTPNLVADMLEMSQATIGSHVNVVVLADWNANSSSVSGMAGIPGLSGGTFPTGSIWYKINGAGTASPIQQLGYYGSSATERNMDDPSLLANAIASAFTTYPAQNYGVIMWDHGGSWEGGFGGDNDDTYNRTTGQATVSHGGMTIAQLNFGIANGVSAAGITGSHPLEFLAFDTCLMSSAEVVSGLYQVSKTYLACAELDYGDGWNYQSTLSYISSNSTASANAIASAEVTHWNAQHATASVMDTQTRSHVAIDCTKFSAFRSAYANFTTAMQTTSGITVGELGRAMFNAVPGYSIDGETEQMTPALKDAKSLFDMIGASGLSAGDSAKTTASTASLALQSMIIAKSQGTVRTAAGQSGVSLEAPIAADWTTRKTAYSTLSSSWNGAVGWSTILDILESNADSVGPLVDASFSAGELNFQSVDADQAKALVRMMLAVSGYPGVYVKAGLVGETDLDPAYSYQYAWDGTLPVIRNGGSSVAVTIEPWVAGALYQAKGKLVEGPDSLPCDMLISADGTVAGFIIRPDGRQQVISRAALGATVNFTPTITVWNPSTDASAEVDGTPINIGAGTPAVDWDDAPSGTYYFDVEMYDIWGNKSSDQVGIVFTAPG